MKHKFDRWIPRWSDGSLLIYFTFVDVLRQQ